MLSLMWIARYTGTESASHFTVEWGALAGTSNRSTHWIPELNSVVLPLKPIWLGFAINVVFYATSIAGIVIIYNGFVFMRRRQMGMCGNCGYMRFDSNECCPECGLSCGLSPLN